MEKRVIETIVPRTLKEFESFRNLKVMMELTYLNLTRLIVVARSNFSLTPDESLQLVFPYADAAIFESMAQDISLHLPKEKVHLVGKALSRQVLTDVASTIDESNAQEADSLLRDFMLKDTRLGVFHPDLPTIWIDSSFSYSFISWFDDLFKETPLGNPAWFYNVNYSNTNSITSSSFSKVISPNTLRSEIGIEGTIQKSFSFEAWTRLPIEKAHIGLDRNIIEPVLKFSQERWERSAYYSALAWCHGPSTLERRKDLIQLALAPETFLSESQKLLAEF